MMSSLRTRLQPKGLYVLGLIYLILCPTHSEASDAKSPQIEVTYLGNEGFLIAAGETRVLVDALFGEGLDGYPVVPAGPRKQLEAATGPFAGVDLVLATHYHGDHFNAEAAAEHLRNNPGARFVSTHQAIDKLKGLSGFAQIADRVQGFWPAEGSRETITHGDVTVTVLNLHHGRGRRPEVQNLGLLIDVGGLRLFHVGDTEVSLDDVRPYDLGAADIDVFFAPTWFFTNDRFSHIFDVVDAPIRVVMHIAAPGAPASWFGDDGSRPKRLERIRKADPKAIIFEAMETRRLPTP